MEKISLTQKDHFFYLLFYEHSADEDPKFLMPFPYHNNDKDEMLETARKQGENMADYFKVLLEENLENNA